MTLGRQVYCRPEIRTKEAAVQLPPQRMDTNMDQQQALVQLEAAAQAGKLSAGAVGNIRAWLTEPRYADYAPEVIQHIAAGKWKELDSVFWTVIPFGTGGRRGKLYPIGTNAINDRTMGESVQGLAEYVREHVRDKPLACAIAYDTRHQSRHFAELSAEVMVANGFKVWFLGGVRSTPELSFCVRYKQCDCGIIITASHNPPSDNAIKAYWATGGQLLPPHDQGVIDRVTAVTHIDRVPFRDALYDRRIDYCEDEVDAAFIRAVAAQSRPGPRTLKIIYSPLHGVGATAVCPALAAAGFKDVEVFGPHAAPDPDFTNVPNHVANPERPIVFEDMIGRAIQTGADLILATDPDCDRVGCAAPKTLQSGAPWCTLTGNQIGALLTEYLLDAAKRAGTLTREHYVVKTIVTTELIRRIADAYGVQTVGDLLVGFKYIGGTIDERGPAKFVIGAEESYGFLVGTHCRDKDAAVISMLLAELTAQAKSQGLSLHQKLDALMRRYGCHVERAFSLTLPGAEGMQRSKALMARFRREPPASLAGMNVVRARDYLSNTAVEPGRGAKPLAGPTGDLVMLDLAAEGNYVAVRPSGTEPLVKFYLFAFEPPANGKDIEPIRAALAKRLENVENDLRTFAET
jgi:phosphoglucomutase/phosphomannomutase